MIIESIPGEPLRYYVKSQSRPDITHIVDADWQAEERWPRGFGCSCEQFMVRGGECKHIRAVKDKLNIYPPGSRAEWRAKARETLSRSCER